ncbi:maltose excess protein 1-like protein, chloroplastic [Tanacetum coccineum]
MTVAPVAVHGGAPPLLHHPSSSSSTKHNPLHHFSPILLNRSTRFHTINKLCVKPTSCSYLSLLKRRRFGLNCSLDSDIPNPLHPQDNEISKKSIEQWDSLTAKFAGVANVPFLLLQLPQIVLNARNLMAGNNAALFAVPWLAISIGQLRVVSSLPLGL